MQDFIEATMHTNLDGEYNHTPQQFDVKFPAIPQVGQAFMWGNRRCHICGITWVKAGEFMRLHVEFNK